MTSSADPRRPAAGPGPRRRVAGARRRPAADAPRRTLVLDDPSRPSTDDATVDDRPQVPDCDASGEHAPAAPAEGAAPTDGERASRPGAAGLWVSAIGAALALAVLAASLVYALRPTVSDTDRTAAVGSARTTLESLLSYSGSTFDKHVGEVTPQLTSPFKDQFTKVAATDIKPMAVKNEATVQAKVYDAGVMDVSGDGGEGTSVRVMAFVNQATTTKAQQAPAIDQNRVIATMRKVGDRWLVSDLSAF